MGHLSAQHLLKALSALFSLLHEGAATTEEVTWGRTTSKPSSLLASPSTSPPSLPGGPHLRFLPTSMRGSPCHRLCFCVCFLFLFLLCWLVLHFCLESLNIIASLFLRKFMLFPSPPANMQGYCISAHCQSGHWCYFVNKLCDFSFYFSFKEKLGPAGPGVSRTKATVLQ